MWGLESMFGKRTEKKRASGGAESGGAARLSVEQAAAEEADAVIAKAAKKDGLPPIGTDSDFQDTEAMPVVSETFPKIGDSSRRLAVPESKPVTPTDTHQGLEQFSISSRDLEKNLDTPVLPKAPLPQLGKVSDPIAPNLWGADQARPPRTGYQPTPVSEKGMADLRIDPRVTEAALADPLPALAHHEERYAHGDGTYDKRQSVRKRAPGGNTAPMPNLGVLEGVEIEQPDPIADRDAKWRQARENFEETSGSSVPASFRGGELPSASAAERLKERQRIADARSVEGLGVYNGRPSALPTDDEKWEAARRAAQEEDMKTASDRAAAELGDRNNQSSLGARESAKEAERETLRQRYWDKIQELRQMIVLATDPSEKELMEDVLARSLKNYERDFGELPAEKA